MSLWTMKEVTRMTGVTENALRYYNSKGVLFPTIKEETGRRQWLYDDEAVERLKQLFLLKYIGAPLDDIKEAVGSEEQFRRIVMKSLEELKRQREALDLKIFVAQTLAVSYGEDLFAPDSEFDERKAAILNDVVKECIRETIKGE